MRKTYAPSALRNGALLQALAGRPRSEITDSLSRHKGRIRNAARDLNATPRALYYYLKRKKIDIASFKKEE